MLVLQLAYSGELDFVEELQELKELLKKKHIIIGVVESLEGKTHIIKIMCDDLNYSDRIGNIINLYISNILYKIVITKYKEKELFEYLTDTYFFLKQDEILEVEEDIMNVLYCEEGVHDSNFIFYCNKTNAIIDKIKECIEENNEININGFITFRMRELRKDIEDVIDKVVEKYMVEKEYREFIRLLKYFVEIQECRVEEINLTVLPSGGYIVTDGYGEDIFPAFLNELSDCKIGIDANVEDIVISGLITNAPQKIVIHKREECKNKEFIETIINVFGERVVFCDGCKLCSKTNIKM
ncbi:putative sporulation protein YtxC [Clostridium paraputrificum]|uniref:YtxC-like family protein n=1 Tax=Clostridium paraputrificum TaxID=29363 RepID=A0A6N3FXR6_9CLOT|nr:putative sporulation protein YtxC [Clostridium sp.]MBS5985083.1 putative sporulation protein YtxC [Clostridium sp.]